MEFVCVGKIVKPQGIKGEVKISPLVDIPAIFNGKHPLFIEKKPAEITSGSFRMGYAYVKFAEIASRNDAEKFRGKKVYITKEEFEALSVDDFLVEELVGSVIFDEKGEMVGQIMGVTDYGFDDILIVRSEGRLFEVPFRKAIFTVTRMQAKQNDRDENAPSDSSSLLVTCLRSEFDGAKVESET